MHTLHSSAPFYNRNTAHGRAERSFTVTAHCVYSHTASEPHVGSHKPVERFGRFGQNAKSTVAKRQKWARPGQNGKKIARRRRARFAVNFLDILLSVAPRRSPNTRSLCGAATPCCPRGTHARQLLLELYHLHRHQILLDLSHRCRCKELRAHSLVLSSARPPAATLAWAECTSPLPSQARKCVVGGLRHPYTRCSMCMFLDTHRGGAFVLFEASGSIFLAVVCGNYFAGRQLLLLHRRRAAKENCDKC